ncbi:MAG: indolepyruvate ferredoxin oxidoreductase [Muribaculaceae bacterium]|nr:indolepyruvate ferredoxin oxidoreductase [Muribaculaceae bacterium]
MKIKKLLLGDEAFALGAINAGLSGAYGYPGTPSTEIMEFIQANPTAKERGIHSHWSSNEKTAYEEALGMSYAGKRSIVTMKHVGLNASADAFVNSGMTGANGGMLVAVADDPSMHSSQNEQDSRFYGEFAFIPVLEPTNQQEAYDMADYGFKLSEKFEIPVMVRFVTRLSHSRATVEADMEAKAENEIHFPNDGRRWVLMPGNSRVRYKELIKIYEKIEKESDESPYNVYTPGKDHSLGIIVSGIASNYINELFPDGCPYPTVKVSQYPLPLGLIKRLSNECKELLIVEEGQPFIEKKLRGLIESTKKIYGKLDGTLIRTGELNPDRVMECLIKIKPELDAIKAGEIREACDITVARPPSLCKGCGHRDVYQALNDVLGGYKDARVFGDIGCYTLGYLAPFKALHTVLDMGASITMAKGASEAGVHPAVAVIGDSTFTHSGLSGLLDAVNEDSNILVIISDNLTTGMTGGQDSQGTGKIEEICLGLGVNADHLHTIDSLPKNHNEMVSLFKQAIEHKGLSVVVSRRECIQTARRHGAHRGPKTTA